MATKGQITPTFVIAFGLLSIPVKSYVANDKDSGFALRNLHRPCALGETPVSDEVGDLRPRVFATVNEAAKCSACEKIIVGPRSSPDIIKGFQLDDGDFVTFTGEEIKALEAEKDKTMSVVGFVPESTVEARWYKANHFLGSTEVSTKAFALLRDRMAAKKMAAIVKYVGYGHDKIGVIRSSSECLILHECYMPDQMRDFASQNRAKGVAELSDRERALADQMISGMVMESLDLSPFADGYRKRVDSLIKARAEGKPFETTEGPAVAPAATDLLAALEASVTAFKKPGTPAPAREVEVPKVEEKKPAKKRRAA